MGEVATYAGLFLAAFLAATFLPAQSKSLVVVLLLANYTPWLVLAVASLGNVPGSVLNWILGRGIERCRDRRWFPASPAAFALATFQSWSLNPLLLKVS
jgi:membrane protein YqaA with SNARE-associated domain